jgi:hypothetical protein
MHLKSDAAIFMDEILRCQNAINLMARVEVKAQRNNILAWLNFALNMSFMAAGRSDALGF